MLPSDFDIFSAPDVSIVCIEEPAKGFPVSTISFS
jgi:hypothetical protein